MSQSEKIYEKIPEANEIIEELVDNYPDELWAIRPHMIEVLGVSNKERPKSSKTLASVRPLKGATKALMQINNVNTRYLMELYWSDWNAWSKSQKVAVIFHELLHIDSEVGKTVKHDVEDFRIMVDKLGVDWFNDSALPNLLSNKIEFNLNLRPNLPDGDMELDGGDEILDDIIDELPTSESKDEAEIKDSEENSEGELF